MAPGTDSPQPPELVPPTPPSPGTKQYINRGDYDVAFPLGSGGVPGPPKPPKTPKIDPPQPPRPTSGIGVVGEIILEQKKKHKETK